MLLNWVEFALMNNPVRAVSQRLEAARLLRMGGPMAGGTALEVGCGRGVGVGLILDVFGARAVDAFDLDPRMTKRAAARTAHRGDDVRLWVGDCSALPVASESYDAVFDFGIIHHVPDWRRALCEIARVLKPGGRFYGEEALGGLIQHPLMRMVLEHPKMNRFDEAEFREALGKVGLIAGKSKSLWGLFAWFTAVKASPPQA